MNEECSSGLCVRVHGLGNDNGLNRLGLGLILKNGGTNCVLINRRADLYHTANVLGGDDRNGYILGNICIKGSCLGSYGFFPLGHLGCGCGGIHKSASLYVVLEYVVVRANVAMTNVVVLGLINDNVNRRGLGSVCNVNRSRGVDYQRIVNKLGRRNILVNVVRNGNADLISIRIRSHIDRLKRIGVGLGYDDTVKTVGFGLGLCIEKKRRRGLKRLEEYGVGGIPLCIVKVLVKLNGAVVVLPLLHLLTLSYVEVKHN